MDSLWRWSNALHAEIPAAKKALCINLDETCVRLREPGIAWCLVLEAQKQKRTPVSLAENASHAAYRACCTHAALISDSPELQSLLPQLILVRESQLREDQFRVLTATFPNNVILKRVPKAWMNSETMHFLFKELVFRLKSVLDAFQIILYMDVCQVHLPALGC